MNDWEPLLMICAAVLVLSAVAAIVLPIIALIGIHT